MSEHDHKIYILGAGAVGHLLGSHFKLAHIQTFLITRQNSDVVNSEVDYISADNERQSLNIDYVRPSELDTIYTLFVCVKSYQLKQALAEIKHALRNNSQVVLLTNGMGNLEAATEVLSGIVPASGLWLAINTHGSYLSNHTVTHTGVGSITYGHNYQSEESRIPGFTLPAALNPKATTDIETQLWLKLAINAVINPLTAIHNCRNGELQTNKELTSYVQRLCSELSRLYHHLQINLSATQVYDACTDVINRTAANFSSMHQDISKSRATEIEAITGYLLKCANRAGLQLPEHENMYHKIKNIEQGHKLVKS